MVVNRHESRRPAMHTKAEAYHLFKPAWSITLATSPSTNPKAESIPAKNIMTQKVVNIPGLSAIYAATGIAMKVKPTLLV